MNNKPFYTELKLNLPSSSAADRKIWVEKIMDKEIELKELLSLLFCEPKIASRFLWLLSEIGESYPQKLFAVLPYLLAIKEKISYDKLEASFANFWLFAGVPIQNEGEATELLFTWLQSSSTNVTTKSRSLFVLVNLIKKYPELKQELKSCLLEQKDKYSNDFKNRAEKILKQL